MYRHVRVANESASMQTLLPSDTPPIAFPLSAHATVDQSLAPSELQWLGDRLRVAYGPVEAPLPARLTELVERLARRERPKD
jgi:hypothetical protein